MMIKAVLFDLDGTLSHMDNDAWMKSYLGLMASRFEKFVSRDKFIKLLLSSMVKMKANNDPELTNQQSFFTDFCQALGVPFARLWPLFQEFYQADFPNLGHFVKPDPFSRRAVETCQKLGLKIGLACNPVMPLEAICQRAKWAGVGGYTFEVIPCLEKMHFCKPNPSFFAELASELGLYPEECLLVANDTNEDLACKSVGMPIFLISQTDEVLFPNPDYRGTLGDCVQFLESWTEKY